MATILEPAPTGNRAVAVRPGQALRLRADTAWNWFVRTNEGGWTQFATGVLEAFTTLSTSVTNRLTFDRVEVAIGSAATPDTSTTRYFDLCEGPPAVLWATDRLENEALSEPPARPWEGEDDDPPLGTPLAGLPAARGGLGTALLETVSDAPGAGPSTLVASWGPGVFVDTAGGLGVRTPFTNDARGLGPFPAIAAWYQGGLYFEHDFGKSRALGLTRVLYEESAAPNHVAVVRGDGRRNTYRLSGGVYTGSTACRNTLTKAGGVFEETTPSGRVYRYDSAGRLTRVVDRVGNPVYYAYDVNNRLQRIDGRPGQDAIGLVPYLSYNASGLLEKLQLQDGATPANTRETYFTYDANRNLLRVVGPELCITYFEYNPATRLQAVTDPGGFRWYFAYDANGRVERVLDALGKPTYFAWTPAAALGAKRDRAGTITYFRWGPFGAPERVYNQLGTATPADYFHYDGDGLLVRSTTRTNRDWYYLYDGRANRLAVTDPLGGRSYFAYDGQDLLRTYVDPLGRATYLAYDGSRNRTQATDPVGGTAYYAYEATGLLRERKDRRGAVTSLQWGARGTVALAVDPVGAVTYFGYNAANERTAQVDPLGRVSYFEYDKRGRLTTQLDPVGAPTYFGYDARCNLVTQRDARLNLTTTAYDGNGNPYYRADPLGNFTYFGYDPEERPNRTRDARGVSTYHTYDGLGRRQFRFDPYGNRVYFAHDAAHQLAFQVDERGSPTYFGYDPAGRLSTQQNAEHRTSYLGYDLAGQRVLTTDFRTPAAPTYSEYDPRGWLCQTRSAIGAVSYSAYDAEGNRVRAIDPRGSATYFTYDLAGRLTHTADALGGVSYAGYDRAGQAVLRVDEAGAPTYLGYDRAGRVQTTLDPAGLWTYHQYDLVGNLVARTLDQGWGRAPWGSGPYGGERATSYFTYDAVNRRQRSLDAYGGATYVAYDRVGNPYFQVDERGFTTYHLYDLLGRRTNTRAPVHFAATYTAYDAVGNVLRQVDPQGATVYFAYDRLDRVYFTFDRSKALTYTFYDAVGNRTEQHVQLGAGGERRSTYFQYDLVGRTTRQLAADGGATYFGYDLAGNQVLAVDPVGRPTYTAYDALNRPTCTGNVFNERTYFSYDARSRTTQRRDPVGRTTYLGYDLAGRLLHQSNALGEFSYFWYDARGSQTHVLNPRGFSTYYRYDLLGRRTHRVDALGGVAYTGYDAAGNRVLEADPLGRSTYLTYDGLNRLTHTKDPAAGVTYLGYDSRSSVVRRRDADGRETYLTYDTAARLTRQVFRTAVAGEASDAPIYFTYDQVDQLKVVDDRLSGLGVTYFDYDKVGRVTKKTALAGAVYYAYDLSGRRTSLKDPDLLESYYLYDAAGRLVREVLAAGQTAYYTYDAAGLVTRRDLPQNVVLAYLTYDVAGRLATLDQLRNGSSVQTRSFLRDANGATVRETVAGTAFNYYTYDALDRLTREIQTSTIALSLDTYYAYDAAGNRTLKGSTLAPGWVYAYTYDARNLLTIETAGGAATTYFDWDAAQRLTRQRASGDTTYYAFNQRDQVARLQNVKAAAADPTQYFTYNGVGERARVRDGDGEAYWSFDGGKLLREKAPGGGITARYRHNTSPQLDLMGSLLQAYFTPDGGGGKQTAVPRYDERGSVVALVTSAGDLAETYTYDRFGVTTGTEGKQRLRFVFGAGLLGLTAARGRYLSPWGLWLPEQGTTSGGAGRPPRYYGGSEIRMVAAVPGLWQIARQEGPGPRPDGRDRPPPPLYGEEIQQDPHVDTVVVVFHYYGRRTAEDSLKANDAREIALIGDTETSDFNLFFLKSGQAIVAEEGRKGTAGLISVGNTHQQTQWDQIGEALSGYRRTNPAVQGNFEQIFFLGHGRGLRGIWAPKPMRTSDNGFALLDQPLAIDWPEDVRRFVGEFDPHLSDSARIYLDFCSAGFVGSEGASFASLVAAASRKSTRGWQGYCEFGDFVPRKASSEHGWAGAPADPRWFDPRTEVGDEEPSKRSRR